jgi:hypothetical protein
MSYPIALLHRDEVIQLAKVLLTRKTRLQSMFTACLRKTLLSRSALYHSKILQLRFRYSPVLRELAYFLQMLFHNQYAGIGNMLQLQQLDLAFRLIPGSDKFFVSCLT